MLQDETTAPAKENRHETRPIHKFQEVLTRVIPANSSLHDRLHPLPDNSLFGRAEKVRLVGVVYNSEAISSRISILIGKNLVPNDVDISLDLRFLQEEKSSKQIPQHTTDVLTDLDSLLRMYR